MIPVAAYAAVSIGYGVLENRLTDALSGMESHERRSGSFQTGRPTPHRPDADSYGVIYERNLFGTLESATPVTEAAPKLDLEAMKKTTLRLKLWGTVAGDPDVAFAVIEDTAKRKQNLYRVGDAIQDAKIRLILRQKVVLTRNGQDEVLEMISDKGQKKSYYNRVTASAQPSGGIQISRDTINHSLKNINQLMRQIRIRPNFEEGKPAGLRVDRIRKDSIFREMGLTNGDVIKGVNGKQIQSVDDALGFYDQLKSASNVSLEIERNGSSETLHYSIAN